MELESILVVKGLDLGSSISGVNFDGRRVRIFSAFWKIGRYGDWSNQFWGSNVDLELWNELGSG
jgi:hypothetical protein